MSSPVRGVPRWRAALIHLGLSGLVAIAAGMLVFAFWYPMPYRELAGGRELFVLVVAVDVALGPLITLVIFDPRKPARELARDLTVVALLQVAGLAYGLYTVEQARPVAIALEVDRLRVVRSIDLSDADYGRAPPGMHARPWLGPKRVATRKPHPDEQLDAMTQALAGRDLGTRPEFWLPESQTAAAWIAGARPLSELRTLRPEHASELDDAVRRASLAEADIKFLPVLARRTDFVVLIRAADGHPVGYAAIDGHR